ncbi:MAG: hypothetical protein V8Q36_08565 [Anaerotignum sp.]
MVTWQKGEHLQVVKNLTIHGGTGKISLTMPETAEDMIFPVLLPRNVTVNGKTLKPEVSVEQNGGDLDSWEMDFDEDFTVPKQKTEGKKQIQIDGGTGEIALTFAGNTEKGATA